MPGYGIAGPTEGSGLLHWSWAAERLTAARNYWVATVWPDGRPHIMPVWGMWDDSTLWFTSSAGSRKVRNLTADPRCSITTEDASDPVIIEGTAHISTELPVLRRVVDLMNAKYRTDYRVDFLDPAKLDECFRAGASDVLFMPVPKEQFVARLAGMKQASSATVVSSKLMTAKVAGSVVLTP